VRGSGCYICGYMASESQISVRQLKNETTGLLRRVEAGERLIVTRRGRPVAVIEPSNRTPVPASDSIYRSLQHQIEARIPGLRGISAPAAQREFERISRKISRTVPYRDWKEMDRVARGDRFGLSRR
jgi:prevent-host-death family protein